MACFYIYRVEVWLSTYAGSWFHREACLCRKVTWGMCREELWAQVTCFCLLAVTELSQQTLPTWQVSHKADRRGCSTSSYFFINVWTLLWGVCDVMVRARREINHVAVPSCSLSGPDCPFSSMSLLRLTDLIPAHPHVYLHSDTPILP